jgi:DNA-binding MarR family transcriptional regulator
VDGLEKEGLVRRVSHRHDRRIKLVELTRADRQDGEAPPSARWSSS